MFDLADPENHPSGAKALLILCGLSARLEHFAEWCRPGFHWYPTHFRKKRGNGWGTGVYNKSENALKSCPNKKQKCKLNKTKTNQKCPFHPSRVGNAGAGLLQNRREFVLLQPASPAAGEGFVKLALPFAKN
jgi:hypothetical protein